MAVSKNCFASYLRNVNDAKALIKNEYLLRNVEFLEVALWQQTSLR